MQGFKGVGAVIAAGGVAAGTVVKYFDALAHGEPGFVACGETAV
jgi:hypothetical protein